MSDPKETILEGTIYAWSPDSLALLKMREALLPPKPKELVITYIMGIAIDSSRMRELLRFLIDDIHIGGGRRYLVSKSKYRDTGFEAAGASE